MSPPIQLGQSRGGLKPVDELSFQVSPRKILARQNDWEDKVRKAPVRIIGIPGDGLPGGEVQCGVNGPQSGCWEIGQGSNRRPRRFAEGGRSRSCSGSIWLDGPG